MPRGPGELGDEVAVGVRSGTMISIHLERIEHGYGKVRLPAALLD
jgi:hypothetical protein